jgi:carbohydrate diacid regulator
MSTLTVEVASRIVERTMAVIGHNVNVMDDRGLILATGDPQRRRQHHEGALVAAQGDRVVVIDDEQARLLHGAQPGVNVPLHHRGEVVGVIGISGDPAEVQVLADLIRVTAELMVEQAGALEHGQRLQQERDDLLTAVVAGTLGGASLERRAAGLGLALDLRRRCAVVRPVREAGVEDLRSLQRRLEAAPDLLVARTEPEELAVWWSADTPRSYDEVRRGVAAHADRLEAAAGEGFAGPHGLRRAALAARDAWRVSHLGDGLYDPRDLPLVALLCGLRDDWRAEAVSAPWQALVAADRHGDLRRTLRTWIEHDLHPGRTAEALHVHRNTLRGRLERIERVTGLDLRRVPHLLQLYLGPLLTPEAEETIR